MAQFDTVANIIADVGTELGLGTLAANYSSTDANVLLLQALLKSTGRALILENPWLQNIVSHTFTTTATTVFYLPADFQSMVDGTGWNRTTRQPIVPVTPSQWEALKASAIATSLIVLLRPGYATPPPFVDLTASLEFLTTATAGHTIALQYRSRYWVATAATALATLDAPAATTNVLRIDAQLITRALKLAWLRQKGFPSDAAQQDFEAALAATRSANISTSPVLALSGRRYAEILDYTNVPESGYGA